MTLVFNKAATDPVSALARSVTVNSPANKPVFVLGDNSLIDLSISDGAGGYDATSGAAGYVPWLGIGSPGALPSAGTFYLGVSSATSGTLTSGKRYLISTFSSGDDFTNVGGTNLTGNVFTASGTTPTTWTHSSILVEITTDITCPPTAATLQTALNATAAIGANGVTVSASSSASLAFVMDWAAVGTRFLTLGYGAGMTPDSAAVVAQLAAGSATVKERQFLRLVANPAALQTTWSAVTNGWQARLSCATRGIVDALNGTKSVGSWLEFQLVDGSGNITTVGQVECTLRNEVVDPAAVLPVTFPSYLTAAQTQLAFIQNRYSVGALTGGGTAMDGIPTGTTANPTIATNTTIAVEIAGYISFYTLKSSAVATNSPAYIRPTDYNSSTNQRVWTLQNVQVSATASPYRVVASTTDATPTEMLTPSGGRLLIPDNTSWVFDAKLVAQSRTYDGGNTWAQRAFADDWEDVCASSDGTRVAVVRGEISSGSGIYVSSDGGVTFTGTGPDGISFLSIACKSDFSVIIAGSNAPGPGLPFLYKSVDYGMTWTAIAGNANQPIERGLAIARTGGGLGLLTDGINLYTSPDFITWTERDSARAWSAVAISDDGTKLAAAVNGGYIYTAGSGALGTWTSRDSNRAWASIKLSSDGSVGVAGVSPGYLYTSADSGATWTQRDSSRTWECVALSADGTKQFAVGITDFVYVSTDSGATWTAKATVAGTTPDAVCSNGDGTRPVCAGIYVGTAGSTSTAQGYCFTGIITKDTTVASAVATWQDNPIGVPTWGFAVSADTTYGALKFTVTGVIATNISWAGTIATSELTS